MKVVKTRITCDGCKALIPPEHHDDPEFVKLRMTTHGYGMKDGLHREHWDICSAECGVKVLKKWIRELEAGDDRAPTNE